jgi:diphthamide biosynthesis methyltransferase
VPQESGKYEGFKTAASAESNIASLQKLVEAKEKELTRQQVEFNSERKRLEKVRRS